MTRASASLRESASGGLVAHLVIPQEDGRSVLLQVDEGRWRLPRVASADPRVGVVEPVAGALRAELGIAGTVLRCLDAEEGAEGQAVSAVYRIERHGGAPPISEALRWVTSSELRELPFERLDHQELLLGWLADGRGTTQAGTPRPWTEPGWFQRAKEWIRRSLAREGLEWEDGPRQLRSEAGSCLMTVTASGRTYWFKATPPGSQREAALTEWLASLRPPWLPPVVASEPEEGWLLLAEVGGRPLYRVADPEPWTGVLSAYATLQIDCVARVGQLHSLGCPDLGPERLVDHLPTVVESALTVLEGGPHALQPRQVKGIRASLPGLVTEARELATAGVPVTLEHGDFHPNNFHVTEAGPVFLDWSDGSVSHPFFSLAAMLTYVQQLMPAVARRRALLRDAYLEPWAIYESPPRLREIFAIAEHLSGLHYARLLTAALERRSGAFWETRELAKALALCLQRYDRPLGWGRRVR